MVDYAALALLGLSTIPFGIGVEECDFGESRTYCWALVLGIYRYSNVKSQVALQSQSWQHTAKWQQWQECHIVVT